MSIRGEEKIPFFPLAAAPVVVGGIVVAIGGFDEILVDGVGDGVGVDGGVGDGRGRGSGGSGTVTTGATFSVATLAFFG
jgi:hypothetical protein